MTSQNRDIDVVSRVIKYCIADPLFAEKTFVSVTSGQQSSVKLPDGEVHLSDEEIGEFAVRYSSEVEPTIWESKRRKQ
jgi:hypothetical protein